MIGEDAIESVIIWKVIFDAEFLKSAEFWISNSYYMVPERVAMNK